MTPTPTQTTITKEQLDELWNAIEYTLGTISSGNRFQVSGKKDWCEVHLGRTKQSCTFLQQAKDLVNHLKKRTPMNINGHEIKPFADLRGADLINANLNGANLEGANLEGADLWGADLMNANLKGANLRGAILEDANLEGANLEGANLKGTDFMNANLKGTILEKKKDPQDDKDLKIKELEEKNKKLKEALKALLDT